MPDPVKYIVRAPTFKSMGKRDESEALSEKVFTEEVAKYAKFYEANADGSVGKDITETLDVKVKTALAKGYFDLANAPTSGKPDDVLTLEEYKAFQEKKALLINKKMDQDGKLISSERPKFSDEKSFNVRLGYEAGKAPVKKEDPKTEDDIENK